MATWTFKPSLAAEYCSYGFSKGSGNGPKGFSKGSALGSWKVVAVELAILWQKLQKLDR